MKGKMLSEMSALLIWIEFLKSNVDNEIEKTPCHGIEPG
jgi:hypothetical protein